MTDELVTPAVTLLWSCGLWCSRGTFCFCLQKLEMQLICSTGMLVTTCQTAQAVVT